MAGIKDVAAILRNQVENLSQKKGEQLVILTLEALKQATAEAYAKGDRLILRDFGTFDIVDVPSRTVRNLHTGEVTTAPESKRVRLKVGTTFKDMVKSLPVCNVEKKAGKAVAEDNAELTQADA